jgi:hypothetical protein
MPGHSGWPTLPTFDGDAVADLKASYEAVTTVAPRYKEIAGAIGNFLSLREIETSPLYVLGLFAIIESLLTHDPEGGYDSLGHQIKNKIPLIAKRMEKPIEYMAFGASDIAKIWSKLYAYRSAIAHGGDADFKNSLKILKSADAAKLFLESAVKRLLRYAMFEPELVCDLRAV